MPRPESDEERQILADQGVMLLEDHDEQLIFHIWQLSRTATPGMSSVHYDNEYLVVRDACRKWQMDVLAVWGVVRAMTGEFAQAVQRE